MCNVWSKAYHLELIEIFDEYYNNIEGNKYWLWFFNKGKIEAEMEFRILHEIFCDQYKIIRGSFEFDQYVQIVFEKLLLFIISIRAIDWFVVCSLVMLNWLRVSSGLNYSNCPQSEDMVCLRHNSFTLFVIAGWLFLMLRCILLL